MYRIWMPVCLPLNVPPMVDPKDLETAQYEVVGTFTEQDGGDTLETIFEAHQNGIEEITGKPSRNHSHMRSLSVGDVVQRMDPYSRYDIVTAIGFAAVKRYGIDQEMARFELVVF